MATVLAYTSPAKGHLFPAAALLLELRRRGHRIVLRTLASEVETMRRLGFDAAPIDPRVPAIVEPTRLPRGTVAALRAGIGVFAQRAPHEAADLRQAIAEHQPDVVLVDVNSWGGLAEAERWAAATGGLFVEFSPYTPAIPSRDAPPFGPGLPPARGPLGRLRDLALRPLVFGTLERAVLPMLNKVRRDLGLSDLADARDMFTRAQLMLVTTAEPFEYPRRDWPEQTVLVGPCEWEPPVAEPSWLADLTDPVVLVTTSSEAQDDGRLVQVALDALADEPVQVVATLPAGIRDSYRIPANAHVEEFVPHSAVLTRSVVAVTHGGMGATQKALARGVPVCVVPFGRDQHEVAQRVRASGAGTSVKPARLTPERLRSAILQARDCADGAHRIRDAFHASGGPQAAADAIEKRGAQGR
ncbi:nucleotide disphospho-sugar-binding domain-containing protein [Micromonospora sp. NPDC050686]|uniref:glycosyltransferase n=1 Tax=Micromonospora sp. NPDC050686 TaxID=3154631 RepID=UPI0033FBD42B